MKHLTFKNYNIADWFSFYRIAVFPILMLLIFVEWRVWFTWMLLISYLTDAIDGQLARRLKISSPRGSQLDSMGDQLTLVAALAGVLYFEHKFFLEEWLFIGIAIGLYTLQMIIAWRKYGKATAFHTYLAKISAILQAAFILWLLWFGTNYWLFYPMIILSILETVEEITLIFMFDEWRSDVKGIRWALREKQSETTKGT
ncbi:MAG: CDP-alcohol phosphatidyltransferase family protein [Salibacteraceae bacterium]